jgi:outer membrane lipoprotein-sorting protein
VALALVVAAFAARPVLASADSTDLPTLTADELVAKVVAADPQPLSGTVVYTANLGLPDVSALAGAMSDSMTSAAPVNLLSGSSTLRVWTDADRRSRVSLLGTTSEYSVVHDATQAWSYTSSDQSVVHYTLSAADAARLAQAEQQVADGTVPVPTDLPTPASAAADVLAQVEQFSTVSLDAATTIAGRDAYQLVVTPTSHTTLISRVVIAVDAQTWNPLRVQVWSTQDATDPALELGFTDVTFATPSDTVLSFSTPAGATVKEVTVPLPSDEDLARQPADGEHTGSVSTSGSGWDTIVTLTGVPTSALTSGALTPQALTSTSSDDLADQLGGSGSGSGMVSGADPQALYDALTTKVDGGRLLSSSLVSVLVLDDGRVLVGAVPAATLLTAAE